MSMPWLDKVSDNGSLKSDSGWSIERTPRPEENSFMERRTVDWEETEAETSPPSEGEKGQKCFSETLPDEECGESQLLPPRNLQLVSP